MGNKILFIGDTHFDDSTPIQRLDDYADVSLYKLNQIFTMSIAYQVKYVIITGDVFNTYSVSFDYFNKLTKILSMFKDNGIEVYSIIGNHDLPYNNYLHFNRTPLNSLFINGMIKHLTTLKVAPNVTIYGLDFNKPLSDLELKDNDAYKVVVAHVGTENTVPTDNIPASDFKDFNLVVLGHDHTYYEPLVIGNTTILRPGAFIRRTKKDTDMNREVCVYIFDTDTKEYTKELLTITPASEAFRAEATQVLNNKVSNYAEMFKNAYFQRKSITLFDKINDLPVVVRDEVKEEMIKFFKDHGIIE